MDQQTQDPNLANQVKRWLEKHAPEFVEEYVNALIDEAHKQIQVANLQSYLCGEYADVVEELADMVDEDGIEEEKTDKLTTRMVRISKLNDKIQEVAN